MGAGVDVATRCQHVAKAPTCIRARGAARYGAAVCDVGRVLAVAILLWIFKSGMFVTNGSMQNLLYIV